MAKTSRRVLIVSDSSPLIALGILDLISVLNTMADNVWVPETVRKECLAKPGSPGHTEIDYALTGGLIHTRDVIPESDSQVAKLGRLLDPGEAQAIALALKNNATLLIDELSGRMVASNLGLSITGSLAVLLKAKSEHFIPAVKPAIDTLLEHNYRYSEALIARVIEMAGEKDL